MRGVSFRVSLRPKPKPWHVHIIETPAHITCTYYKLITKTWRRGIYHAVTQNRCVRPFSLLFTIRPIRHCHRPRLCVSACGRYRGPCRRTVKTLADTWRAVRTRRINGNVVRESDRLYVCLYSPRRLIVASKHVAIAEEAAVVNI